jgi:MraZ protein
MNYPIGEYYCKLDSKGRLLLPSSFKEQLSEVIEEGFALRPSLFGDCLELFGMSDWRAMQEKLGRLNPF